MAGSVSHEIHDKKRDREESDADQFNPSKRTRPFDDDRLVVLDLLACVGDRAKEIETISEQISKLVPVLNERLDNSDTYREAFDHIGNGLLRCGLELPYCAGIYASIAAMLTSRNSKTFGVQLAKNLGDAVYKELFNTLRDGHAAKARRALRFIAELSKSHVLSVSSLVNVLETILDAAESELSQPSRGARNVHARGEFLASVGFSVLPWCGTFLASDAKEAFDQLLKRMETIKSAWVPKRWRAISLGNDKIASECFGELLVVFSDLVKAHWKVNPDTVPPFLEPFKDETSCAPAVELDSFVLPAHSKLTRYAPPRFRLCLLSEPETSQLDILEGNPNNGAEVPANEEDLKKDEDMDDADVKKRSVSDVESNPRDANETLNKSDNSMSFGSRSNFSSVDRYVLRQYVTDVLDNFVSDHVKSAERLLNVPMLLSANDIIVEGVFSELCAIPTPFQSAVYYGTVFVDLCKVKDSRLPIKLLAAVEKVFNDSEHLDPEVFDRLTEWFAFHLSNFEYKWNWSDWAVYADKDMVGRFPFRALFCKDVLDRSIRLSYMDRISKMLTPEMSIFLPPPSARGNTARFDEEIVGKLVKIVAGAGKQTPDVVKSRLEELLPDSSYNNDGAVASVARLEAIIRAILQGSAQTLSHFDTLVERYLSLLLELSGAGGVTARRVVALEAGTFWSHSNLRRLYVLDKLSMYRVIDGLSILDYLFSDQSVNSVGKLLPLEKSELCARMEDSSMWEVCRLVYCRARSRLDTARQELAIVSGAASTAVEGDVDFVESRLEKAKHAAQNAKAELRELVLLGLRRLFALCNFAFEDAAIGEVAENDGGSSVKASYGEGQICSWRGLGMIREIGRKHPEQLGILIDELREETTAIRDRNASLQEVFGMLEEIAGCDIHVAAC